MHKPHSCTTFAHRYGKGNHFSASPAGPPPQLARGTGRTGARCTRLCRCGRTDSVVAGCTTPRRFARRDVAALRSRDELLLGVIYEPVRDECFYTWQGGGAYLNGVRMCVSDVASLDEAYVVAELPYNASLYARTAEHLIRSLYGRVSAIRMNGSAALALCYVAAGRYDAWMEAFIGKWDFSAAALMIQEAGGVVTDFRGNTSFLEGHHIVAANPSLHSAVLNIVQECLPDGL